MAVVGGQVAAAGPLAELQQSYPHAPLVNKGKALTPPVVNAHTHLDLSSVPYFRGGYTQFIKYVIGNSDARGVKATEQGLGELLALGAGAFGDIAYSPATIDWLVENSPLPGTAYLEVINRNPDQAELAASKVAEQLSHWRSKNSRVRVGISPHTPYNVSPALLKKLVEIARLEGFPMQMHVAESPEETELMTGGAGKLQQLPPEYGLPAYQSLPGTTPVRYLAELGVLGPHLTIVHGVQVDHEEVQLLAQSGSKVVSCPRSNAGLDCGLLPWELYLKYRLEVALGTDSRASSPDLDVRNEALYLWGRVDSRALVRAATRHGYRVLGLEAPRITRGTATSQVQSW